MKFKRFAGWFLLVCLVSFAGCTGCKKPAGAAPPPAAAQPAIDPLYGHLLQAQRRLPTIKVFLTDLHGPVQEMTAEIASEPVQIATGMMFRTNMPENEAM